MDFDTLLGQIEASRPDLSDSLSMIRQFQKQKQENSDVVDVEKEATDELRSVIAKQRNINKNLFRQYQQLEENYQALMAHLDQLAEALGACPECWGEDIHCGHCAGRGKPGYYRPDQHYFEHYVKPVINKFKTTNQISNNN